MSPRKHKPLFPGFDDETSWRTREVISALAMRRQELGLSQTEVAARMGTSQSTVARLEADAMDVRFSTLQRYAAAIGSSIEWELR
ncbi:MAG TPA: helix-turn-helix transcriptional regulator [Acidimicrobiales bacterium]|nr:helix-turn-helix transcriptional regulator [Acidimicrobiales bacterium]